MKHPTSVRLPDMTIAQLEALIEQTGMTQSEVITTAIDRMYAQETRTMNSVMSVQYNGFTVHAIQDGDSFGYAVESDKASTHTLPGASHPTPAAAIEAGKRAADELVRMFPHVRGQDVIADAASPTGLWAARWDGTDWVPQTDADGMRIPAKPK